MCYKILVTTSSHSGSPSFVTTEVIEFTYEYQAIEAVDRINQSREITESRVRASQCAIVLF